MHDVLVYLDEPTRWSARLDFARALAERSKGRLCAAYAIPPIRYPVPSMSRILTEAEVESILAAPAAARDQARAAFDAATRGAGVKLRWLEADRPVRPWLLELAPYHDCLVLGPAEEMARVTASDTFRLLISAGCPILLVPEHTSAARDLGRLVVAWDGSREAARAVHDALPLIDAARSVTVVSVHPSSDDAVPGLDALRRALARRNGAVSTRLIRGSADAPGEALLAAAREADADLLVMGGFGHTRAYEYWIGGATRDVLEGTELPVLLSH